MSDAAWQTVERIDRMNREIEREAADLRIELADARECRRVYRERLVHSFWDWLNEDDAAPRRVQAFVAAVAATADRGDSEELDRFLDCWAHEVAGGRIDGSF